jgi:hypothetical protein
MVEANTTPGGEKIIIDQMQKHSRYFKKLQVNPVTSSE